MRRGWVPLVGWGGPLLFWTGAELPFGPNGTELGLLGGAGLFCVLLGGGIALAERRRGVARENGDVGQTVPDTSAPAVLLGIGVAVLVAGLRLGPWAILLGGGTALIG